MISGIAFRFSDDNRLKKYSYFMEYFKPTSVTRVLDVGGSEDEYQQNANILEKRYPYPEQITMLGVEEFKQFRERYTRVKVRVYDGKNMPFHDKEFDLCWSNAVLEHVKPGEEREKFLGEIRRVSKRVFITTPNRYFPIEAHTRLFFLHWLPRNIFNRILVALGMKWASGDYMSLMSKRDIIRLLRKCGIIDYKIKANRIFGFTIDFVIIF